MNRGRITQIGDTLVSCRRDTRGAFVSVADAIETLIASQPGLTATQISQVLFANKSEAERVDLMCRRLIAEGRLKRSGAGTVANPFAYRQKTPRHAKPH